MNKSQILRKLKKQADKEWSWYIRLRDKGVCFTCGKQSDPKYMQCGHFISRSYNYYRYDEKNTHCQCVGCNVFKHGNMVTYSNRFIDTYGIDTFKEYERLRFLEKKFTIRELEDIIVIAKNRQKLYE